MEAHNEEMVPHPFNSRTPYEPGDDRDIWCRDCEYHRDHQIHIGSTGERERDRLRRASDLETALSEIHVLESVIAKMRVGLKVE